MARKILPPPAGKTAIEELRLVVRNFGGCSENFVARFTVAELLQIHRAWQASGWDFYPDKWAERQVKDALRGIPPQWWASTEKPYYADELPQEDGA